MICFHFTIFVVLETTKGTPISHQNQLWFAFILLSLSYWKQHPCLTGHTHHGCDLLSFYYLCRTGNNMKNRWLLASELWFAFILLSLSYWKQLSLSSFSLPVCCDLLSFYYLCRTGNNITFKATINTTVVICFHFTIFVVLETTKGQGRALPNKLWFAFILLSLSYWKQRLPSLLPRRCCCDLLSFYYLCRTGNNRIRQVTCRLQVVICFHFTIFVVLETTFSSWDLS